MTTITGFPDRTSTEDEWLWLEDIYADDALAWVEDQNTRTMSALDASSLERSTQHILEVLDSDERIPMVSKEGSWFYNLWRDAEHPRGLWRRTTLESYRNDNPDWDVILNVDELARQDGIEWVFSGASFLFPDYTRALIRLSPDGGDAVVIREFDVEKRQFVTDGFHMPQAKGQAAWVDRDTVLIATDFGSGSMTKSSYPRQVRRWQRGTPLASAELIYEIPADHMGVWAYYDHTIGFQREILEQRIDFFHGYTYILVDGAPTLIEAPEDADLSFHREWLVIRPRSEWSVAGVVHPAGALLATNLASWMKGERSLVTLFTPDAHTSLVGFDWTRNHLLLQELRDVTSRIEVLTPGTEGWSRQELGSVQPNGTISVFGVDEDASDDYWMVETGFLQPHTLKLGTVGNDEVEALKSSPSFFDESRFEVRQHFATSDDGTSIPYFQVSTHGLTLDHANPTLLRGYGGFSTLR